MNNSFEGYVNRKPFVSGTYSFKDTILSFVDNGTEQALLEKYYYEPVTLKENDRIANEWAIFS